jgi:hypothetical protein
MNTRLGSRGGLERDQCEPFLRWTARVSVALLPTTVNLPPVYAQEHIALPPVNLGGSSFMDGVGGPGLLAREALGAFRAARFTDASGHALPGENTIVAFTSTTLVGYMPQIKALGGNWGVEVLVPVVYADVTTPSGSASTTGIGDFTCSALVWQAPPLVLGAGQISQRLDLDVVVPTGQYASSALVTAGSNLWSVNPYYAFTWLATDRIETSWRFHYLWNSTNTAPGPAYEATRIQPGQAVHFNGAASVAVVPEFRVGVAGYFLRQLTDSKANGQPVLGSQEQVAGLGPGFLAQVGALEFVANVYTEFAVQNRPRGTRANAVVMAVW